MAPAQSYTLYARQVGHFSFPTNASKLVNTNYGHHYDGIKVLYPGVASFPCCTTVTAPSQAFKIWRCAALCVIVGLGILRVDRLSLILQHTWNK